MSSDYFKWYRKKTSKKTENLYSQASEYSTKFSSEAFAINAANLEY